MDNGSALFLALAVVAVFVADATYFEWGLPVILGKLVADISNWIAFWR